MVNTFNYFRIAFIIAVLTCCMHMKAQDNHKLTTAMETLKGIDKTMSMRQALDVVRNHAVNDSNAYAMNVLGIAYMAGKELNKIPCSLCIGWNRQVSMGTKRLTTTSE